MEQHTVQAYVRHFRRTGQCPTCACRSGVQCPRCGDFLFVSENYCPTCGCRRTEQVSIEEIGDDWTDRDLSVLQKMIDARRKAR